MLYLAAGVIIVASFLFRLFLLASGWPLLLSDEGTMGLAALHIAAQNDHPLFLYGQNYMGTLEAYLAALPFRLTAPSLAALRFPLLILFALFQINLYALGRLLYDGRVALLALLASSLGTYDVLIKELEADGGYLETLLFGSAVCLIACRIACATDRDGGRRWDSAYGLCGLAIGLGLWSDPLVLPFVAGSLAVLGICRPRDLLRGRGGALLALGSLVGALPLIVATLATAPARTSIRLPLGPSLGAHHLTRQLLGTFLVALPTETGGSALCALDPRAAWPLHGRLSPHTVLCSAVHAGWSAGFLLLWLVAAAAAARGCLVADTGVLARRRHLCQLMLLATAACLLLAFAVNPVAAQTPKTSARYLLPLLIALPAILAPLAGEPSPRRIWGARGASRGVAMRHACRWAAVAGVLAVLLSGTLHILTLVRQDAPLRQQQRALTAFLLQRGIDRVYTDYWTCDRLAFQSRERILCAVLDDRLRPGLDRYLPYRRRVEATPDPAYLFPVASPQAALLVRRRAAFRIARVLDRDGYLIFLTGIRPPVARGPATMVEGAESGPSSPVGCLPGRHRREADTHSADHSDEHTAYHANTRAQRCRGDAPPREEIAA